MLCIKKENKRESKYIKQIEKMGLREIRKEEKEEGVKSSSFVQCFFSIEKSNG